MDKNAKIIATIGPACQSDDILRELILQGMNVARLNFSHGSHEEHAALIKKIRNLSVELEKPVAILQDLQGPKIRIERFKKTPVFLEKGQSFTLTTSPIEGNEYIVSTSYAHLPQDVKAGDQILVNDGLIKLEVQAVSEKDVFTIVINGGALYDRKGINLPGVTISEPSLTQKDRKDLEFGLSQGVDYVALSFVRDAQSLHELRALIQDKQVKIVAKIEKPEALTHLQEIIQAADVLMVARGDLGVEIPAEQVPVVQKHIIRSCLKAGKAVITATQMLDSMMLNPVPTRAETSDVANAIFDGSDAVMLSGESAFGKFPVESVTMMNKIICAAEKETVLLTVKKPLENEDQITFDHAVCRAAYFSANEIGAKYILVLTETGSSARMMSGYRPRVPILALTKNINTYRQLNLNWGIRPEKIDVVIKLDENLSELDRILLSKNFVKKGDRLVVIAGTSGRIGGTDMLRYHTVSGE